MSEPPPALWRLATASLVDAAPEYAFGALVAARSVLSPADPAPDTVDEPDAEQATSCARPLDESHNADVARRMRRALLAYGWLEVALICAFGRTQGMALVGLKVVDSGGASIGITGAFARAFGPSHLIRALIRPLRGLGPTAHGGASIALGVANAAAAVVDPAHRTPWNRLAGTRVVRA